MQSLFFPIRDFCSFDTAGYRLWYNSGRRFHHIDAFGRPIDWLRPNRENFIKSSTAHMRPGTNSESSERRRY